MCRALCCFCLSCLNYVCVVLSTRVPHSGFDLFAPSIILIFAQWIYILLLLYSSIDFISIFLHSIYLEEKSIESMWCRLTINTTELLTFHTFIHRHSICDPMHYHTLGQLSLQTSVLPEVDLVGEAFLGYFALVTLSDL